MHAAAASVQPVYAHLRIDRDEHVASVVLARPQVHNAFHAELIEELGSAFGTLGADPAVRVIVLRGDGPSFSAGADINWMRSSASFTRQQNVDDAQRLGLMLESIVRCAKPVVCRVHGVAMGGALGLLGAADYVVMADDVRCAFSEVKLGLVPAIIAPYVLRKLSPGNATALFVTGERFDAARALRVGLAHVVVPAAELDAAVDRVVANLLTAAPDAISVAKHLIYELADQTPAEAFDFTVETIATKRTDPEGQEGLGAFLERRPASWMVGSDERSSRSRS